MAFRQYKVTLSATAQQLTPALLGETDDVPMGLVTFQILTAGSGIAYIGSSALASATLHGFRLDPADTAQPVVLNYPGIGAPLKLSDFWVLGGVGEFLMIGACPI
jgi:hypothetical protein